MTSQKKIFCSLPEQQLTSETQGIDYVKRMWESPTHSFSINGVDGG